MLDEYKTILFQGEASLIEKKSKFIATVIPTKTEEEAKESIMQLKKKYWDATHNVFAYQIGEKNEIQRFSDDGEPQGTAGKPVLDVLIGLDLKNVTVVVTRYFGGTLLGTGGLVRAYGGSAKLGIEEAGVALVTNYNEYSVSVDYTTSGKIQYEITNGDYLLKDCIYTDKVEFIVFLHKGNEDAFLNVVKELSAGKADIKVNESIYGAIIKNKFLKIDN